MTDWVLAQINVAEALYDLDDPEMAGFTNRLDEVNAAAEAYPGFIWRLKSASGNATDIALFPENPRFIVNVSVWEDFDSLSDFVFGAGHLDVMRQRHVWFKVTRQATFCLWWIPRDGPMPTAEEAWERLCFLREKGATPAAFPLKRRFERPAA